MYILLHNLSKTDQINTKNFIETLKKQNEILKIEQAQSKPCIWKIYRKVILNLDKSSSIIDYLFENCSSDMLFEVNEDLEDEYDYCEFLYMMKEIPS
jgi:hypothetical protein